MDEFGSMGSGSVIALSSINPNTSSIVESLVRTISLFEDVIFKLGWGFSLLIGEPFVLIASAIVWSLFLEETADNGDGCVLGNGLGCLFVGDLNPVDPKFHVRRFYFNRFWVLTSIIRSNLTNRKRSW